MNEIQNSKITTDSIYRGERRRQSFEFLVLSFELGKRELGMDHFEVRCWQAIHRHFYVSQLSQLFCARVHQDLREKNYELPVSYGGAGSRRSLCVGDCSGFAFFGKNGFLPPGSQIDKLLSTSQSASKKVSSQKDACSPAKNRHKNQSVELLYAS